MIKSETIFLPEKDFWQRSSRTGLDSGVLSDLRSKSPQEKFRTVASTTIRLMNDIDETILSEDGIDRMLLLLETRAPDFVFKSPIASAMGYVAAFYGNRVSYRPQLSQFNKVLDIKAQIDHMLTSTVDAVDVLRYAKMCLVYKIY
jgi:hypothetical protein